MKIAQRLLLPTNAEQGFATKSFALAQQLLAKTLMQLNLVE